MKIILFIKKCFIVEDYTRFSLINETGSITNNANALEYIQNTGFVVQGLKNGTI